MNSESNYPDWCVGSVKSRCIDGILSGGEGAVMREDILFELGELERERENLDERIAELREMLGRIEIF